MKTKTTSKAIRAYYGNIYQAPYASLQHIMSGHPAAHYHCGVYGWNYDVYTYGLTIAITTGYRGTFGTKVPSEIIDKYSSRAQAIICENRYDWDTTSSLLAANRDEFFEALLAI
jgi:hypothetical protein